MSAGARRNPSLLLLLLLLILISFGLAVGAKAVLREVLHDIRGAEAAV